LYDEAAVASVYAKVRFSRNESNEYRNKTFNISLKMPTKQLKKLDAFKIELKKHLGLVP
jgi:hypothetical protein